MPSIFTWRQWGGTPHDVRSFKLDGFGGRDVVHNGNKFKLLETTGPYKIGEIVWEKVEINDILEIV